MHSNVTSKNVSGFTLAGPPCIRITPLPASGLGDVSKIQGRGGIKDAGRGTQ